MNLLKQFVLFLLTAAIIICVILYTSCTKNNNKDACSTNPCHNGGTCYVHHLMGAMCSCPPGYYGDYCETTVTCAHVTCQNGGFCTSGKCVCPAGTGGSVCQTIYRETYANSYKGSGTDNSGNVYSAFKTAFNTKGDSITIMSLQIKDSLNNNYLPEFSITLSNTTDSGSDFTVRPLTSGVYSYTGTGRISATATSLTLNSSSGAVTTTYTFNNFMKL